MCAAEIAVDDDEFDSEDCRALDVVVVVVAVNAASVAVDCCSLLGYVRLVVSVRIRGVKGTHSSYSSSSREVVTGIGPALSAYELTVSRGTRQDG